MALMVCIHHFHFNSPRKLSSSALRVVGNLPAKLIEVQETFPGPRRGYLGMEKIRKNIRGCQFTQLIWNAVFTQHEMVCQHDVWLNFSIFWVYMV